MARRFVGGVTDEGVLIDLAAAGLTQVADERDVPVGMVRVIRGQRLRVVAQ
jgi:hypothetical protein